MPITAESTITSIGCTFLIQPTVERANMPNDAKSRGLILKLSCQKGEKTVIKPIKLRRAQGHKLLVLNQTKRLLLPNDY